MKKNATLLMLSLLTLACTSTPPQWWNPRANMLPSTPVQERSVRVSSSDYNEDPIPDAYSIAPVQVSVYEEEASPLPLNEARLHETPALAVPMLEDTPALSKEQSEANTEAKKAVVGAAIKHMPATTHTQDHAVSQHAGPLPAPSVLE